MRTLVSEIVTKEGEKVTLMGWVSVRRDHGKLIFIDLRDRSGVCQLVFTPTRKSEPRSIEGVGVGSEDCYFTAQRLRSEWVVKVIGQVNKRPPAMVNKDIPTGEYEVLAESLEVLNEAATPPFDLGTDGYEVNEETRMKYRYVDLRRKRLSTNLRVRASVIKTIRDFLTERGFVEIETPILSKSTPEGARDYLVPSRVYPGNFYALPQSPQQYKQLLMVAGLERYFQIARCFRDEDTRGDRQPEFTQLDLEMSFTSQEEVLNLIEELYTHIVMTLFPDKQVTQTPFPRVPYREVMEKYNSDKPDLRKDKNDPKELAFAFVVDFPMFEWKETEKRWDAVHHPFTMPRVENADDLRAQFSKNPADILAHQYDFVLNGYEIGGGSIRIHDPELLMTVFELMGNERKDVENKFGHILEAFRYGVPPHGGIAPGIDRFVMILQNEPNIREVMAFPKTGDGRDPMMRAPSEVDKKQLAELGLEVKKSKH